jgi:hypothetical protein
MSKSSIEETPVPAAPVNVNVNVAAQSPAPNTNGAAVAGMVLGIVGACIAFIPFAGVLGALLGGLAFIFGLVGVIKASKRGGKGKGQGIAGLVLGAASVVIFMVISMATVSAINDVLSEGADDTAATAGRAEKATAADIGIGQAAADGDLTFTVESIKCGAKSFGEGFDEVRADGHFCVLSLSVLNHSDSEVSFDGSDQHLIDEAGRKFNPEISFLDDFGFETLNPGIQLEGQIPFDVPVDVTPAAAELHDSFLSDGVIVRLK